MSPHFGLMDQTKMSAEAAALQRARLHWRGGCRRLREEKTAAGIATLYDALLFGLRWYLLKEAEGRECPPPAEDLEDEREVLRLASRAGVLNTAVDLAAIQALVDRALAGAVIAGAQEDFIAQVKTIMTRVGVLPFDLSQLPPEDPATY